MVENVYCLTCGYNLRGLSGTTVRCPECGQDNDLEIARIPAGAIAPALRRMEGAVMDCVGATLGIAALLTLGLTIDRTALTLGIAGLPFWLYFVFRARRSFDKQPGWIAVLAQYHAITILYFATLAMIVWAGRGSPWPATRSLSLAMFGGLAILTLVSAVLLHCRAHRSRLALQRGRAVRIAQEQLRGRFPSLAQRIGLW